jgi:hypothetical protein
MKLALIIAVVILLFVLFKPIVIEGYYDAKAEAEYKAIMMKFFQDRGKGKKLITDNMSEKDSLALVNDFIVVYNVYAQKTGQPTITAADAADKFPLSWMKEYNDSIK